MSASCPHLQCVCQHSRRRSIAPGRPFNAPQRGGPVSGAAGEHGAARGATGPDPSWHRIIALMCRGATTGWRRRRHIPQAWFTVTRQHSNDSRCRTGPRGSDPGGPHQRRCRQAQLSDAGALRSCRLGGLQQLGKVGLRRRQDMSGWKCCGQQQQRTIARFVSSSTARRSAATSSSCLPSSRSTAPRAAWPDARRGLLSTACCASASASSSRPRRW